MAHAFRFLNAGEPFVARVARSALVGAMRWKIRREPISEDIACYHSGSVDGDLALPSTSRASFWSRVRAAAARTAKKFGYRWRWDSGRSELSLECPERGGRNVTVPPTAKRQVINRIRAAVSEPYMSELLARARGSWGRPPVIEQVIASCGQESIFASVTGALFTVHVSTYSP